MGDEEQEEEEEAEEEEEEEEEKKKKGRRRKRRRRRTARIFGIMGLIDIWRKQRLEGKKSDWILRLSSSKPRLKESRSLCMPMVEDGGASFLFIHDRRMNILSG